MKEKDHASERKVLHKSYEGQKPVNEHNGQLNEGGSYHFGGGPFF